MKMWEEWYPSERRKASLIAGWQVYQSSTAPFIRTSLSRWEEAESLGLCAAGLSMCSLGTKTT